MDHDQVSGWIVKGLSGVVNLLAWYVDKGLTANDTHLKEFVECRERLNSLAETLQQRGSQR